MTEKDFNKEKILSSEDIIKGLHLKIDKATAEVTSLHPKVDKAFAEVIRRDETKDEYYEASFRLEKPTTRRVLDVLRESSGAHRFTDIRRLVVCSPTTLTTALDELVMEGLVRWEGGLYQAVSPAWFVQKKLEQKRGKF